MQKGPVFACEEEDQRGDEINPMKSNVKGWRRCLHAEPVSFPIVLMLFVWSVYSVGPRVCGCN